jgi:hypothetical protein
MQTGFNLWGFGPFFIWSALMRWILLVVALVLAGCAGAPVAPPAFGTSQNITASYDWVWDGVMNVLAQNNVQIKTLAKDSGFMSADSARFTERFARCDERLVHNVRKYATFNIRVQRGEQVQKMTVNSEWRLVGRNTITGYPEERECASTGLLEGYLLSSTANSLPVAAEPIAISWPSLEVVTSKLSSPVPLNAPAYASVGDFNKLPASDSCKRLYQEEFLAKTHPRAVALSPLRANGRRYCTYRSGMMQPAASALESCTAAALKEGLAACKLYAVNDTVVWQPD